MDFVSLTILRMVLDDFTLVLSKEGAAESGAAGHRINVQFLFSKPIIISGCYGIKMVNLSQMPKQPSMVSMLIAFVFLAISNPKLWLTIDSDCLCVFFNHVSSLMMFTTIAFLLLLSCIIYDIGIHFFPNFLRFN